MNKLDELLAIFDKSQRQSALLKYAASLGVSAGEVQKKDGQCNEERLVLLIYDAQLQRKQNKTSNYRFYVIGSAVCAVLFFMILFVPRIFIAFHQDEKQSQSSPNEKVIQGFDDSGKPLTENNKPVLFKMMHGQYDELDNKGQLKYKYLYDQGRLVQRNEYGLDGTMIKTEDYPEE